MISYDVIIRPIVTERSMAGAADKKYVFEAVSYTHLTLPTTPYV